jgi:integrase
LASAGTWPNHDLIFTRPIGMPIDGRNLPRLYFFPLLQRAGLPRLRFHELRHSAATMAIHEGTPISEVGAALGVGVTKSRAKPTAEWRSPPASLDPPFAQQVT